MQGVLVFASEAARDAAITSPQEGQFAYTKDNNSLWYYTGSVWAASGATGDIEGVTAGTGISGGGTSGTVTITNSMATEIDAKGDLVVGTGADTFARLAVGTNDYVLTASSGEATGLIWAALPAASSFTYAVFRDEKSSGTNGGTATLGAWRTRDINATQFNDISGASLSSNQITLPAGTYLIEGECQGVAIDVNQVRFQNITDSTTAVLGQNMYTEQSTNVGNMARVSGIFTIAGSKAFEFQQQCTFTKATNGFGVANSFGTNVYASITITKVA
jgi:hypothetical protein